MRNIKTDKLSLLLFLLLIISCSSPVVFDDSYPKGIEELDQIPIQYQGYYMCESDSTLIVINDNNIYAQSSYFFESELEEMLKREQCTIQDGEIYLEEIEECIPFEYISEDSIRGMFYDVDTLFRLSQNARIKPYKGSLVLSQRIDNKEWILTLLSMDAYGNIIYKAITEEYDLETLQAITNTEQIDVDRNNEPIYKVKPTKKEFDALFESEKIFIECEYLIHVNPEFLDLFIF